MNVLPVCLCTVCAQCLRRAEKGDGPRNWSNWLLLGLGIEPRCFGRAANALKLLSNCFSPQRVFSSCFFFFLLLSMLPSDQGLFSEIVIHNPGVGALWGYEKICVLSQTYARLFWKWLIVFFYVGFHCLSFKKCLHYFYFMCVSFLPACLYICEPCASAHGGQKWVVGPLELELRAVVSCHVGAKNQIQLLWKNSNAFNCWAIAPPRLIIYLWIHYLYGSGLFWTFYLHILGGLKLTSTGIPGMC